MKNQKGFTFVEVLIVLLVIVIIGLLVAAKVSESAQRRKFENEFGFAPEGSENLKTPFVKEHLGHLTIAVKLSYIQRGKILDERPKTDSINNIVEATYRLLEFQKRLEFADGQVRTAHRRLSEAQEIAAAFDYLPKPPKEDTSEDSLNNRPVAPR